MTPPAIELSGVCKTYGPVRAVEEVDLSVRPGECVALAGHNGAGKSTLIKLMLGLARSTRGQVSVLGEDPCGPRARRAEIGYLPETLVLHPAMTGAETLAFYARLKRTPPEDNRELIEQVGIGHAAGRPVGTYSKGMRQRLGLAQALLGAPKVLLLDEPTTGLDPSLRQRFYELVAERRDAGAAVLLSSHALTELKGQADRIVIMNRGRKTADGALSELRGLAALPARIRIRLQKPPAPTSAGKGAPLEGWTRCGERDFELRCAERDKATALQNLGALGYFLEDVEICSPGLDEIYAHFLRREPT